MYRPLPTNPRRSSVGRCCREGDERLHAAFRRVLADKAVAAIFDHEVPKTRRETGPFTTDATLAAFIAQLLAGDCSCSHAVASFNAERLHRGLAPCAFATSSYCKAREKLPVGLVSSLTRHLAGALEQQSTPYLWRGRHVKIIDGTATTAPDTPANRLAFPQHPSQKPGLGLPMPRLVVMTSLGSGAVVDLEMGAIRGPDSSEAKLASRLLRSADAGDVIVGDRYYASFAFLSKVVHAGCDFLARQGNGRRRSDFRRGFRLGKDDHLIVWHKPKSGSRWLSSAEFAALPATQLLREVRVNVHQAGQRSRRLTLVTTLLSPSEYPKEALAELYRQRWHVELDLRSLKRVMHLEELRCRTPRMLTVEVWTTALAYNLVRTTMLVAAQASDVAPRRLSFKISVRLVAAFREPAAVCAMLGAIARQKIPTRPGRSEPRQIKRNPKKFDLLKRPRTAAWEAFRACG